MTNINRKIDFEAIKKIDAVLIKIVSKNLSNNLYNHLDGLLDDDIHVQLEIALDFRVRRQLKQLQ